MVLAWQHAQPGGSVTLYRAIKASRQVITSVCDLKLCDNNMDSGIVAEVQGQLLLITMDLIGYIFS